MTDRRIGPIVLFLGLLLVLSGLAEALAIATGFQRRGVIAVMWSVGVSAMLALKLSGRGLSELGWSWGPARYHLIAIALPLAYCVVAYGGAGLAGLAQFPAPGKLAALVETEKLTFLGPTAGPLVTLLLIAAAGAVQATSTALGEEIGWRGFLTPRLTGLLGFAGATLATGVIWAAWHSPLVVLSNYNAGGDVRFELASFAVMVVAMSGTFAWLRLASGSLWPCATLHAAHNLIVQAVFDPLSARGPGEITMVTEFGVVLAGTVLVFSAPFWVLGVRAWGRARR
jgi:membrane protease YdiL (CAAX protease family)